MIIVATNALRVVGKLRDHCVAVTTPRGRLKRCCYLSDTGGDIARDVYQRAQLIS